LGTPLDIAAVELPTGVFHVAFGKSDSVGDGIELDFKLASKIHGPL